MKKSSFEELRKLAKEGKCLNCAKTPGIMNPLYANPRPDIYIDMLIRFSRERVGWLLVNGGICIGCSNFK